MPIPNEVIDNIRNSVNIVEVIGQYVSGLKQVGRNYRASCPFHSEKSPSFYISPSKNIFNCFGCKVGGDVFKFLMKIENITYVEAIRKLASRMGIQINETLEDKELSQDKKILNEILESAACFYHEQLLESRDAINASKYLAQRGINRETVNKFKLGYAHYSDVLFNHLKDKFPTEILLKSGIIGISEQSQKPYDFLHGRIIFPIYDFSGKVIAFGGRILGSNAQPSYLNTPDSIVYNKSRSLYGLFQAKEALRDSKNAIVVEGYMDVLMCHQFGLGNVVAPLGTSFTREQARFLKRATDSIVIAFDSDESGRHAAAKAGEMCLEDDIMCTVASLPEGVDPDEYLLRSGAGAFKALIDSSASIIEFKSAVYLSKSNLTKTENKIKYVRDMLETIIKIKDAAYRHEMIKFVADKAKIGESVISEELNKISGKKKFDVRESVLDNLNINIRNIEEEIVSICLQFPNLLDSIPLDLFTDERCVIVLPLMADVKNESSFAKILDNLDEDTAQWFTQLAVSLEETKYEAPGQKLVVLIRDLKLKRQEEKRKELEKEVIPMCEGKIPVNMDKLREFDELNKLLKGTALKT